MTPRPYMADPEDIDREGYRVIRASDGRPLAYIEKGMWLDDQEGLCFLFLRSPELFELVKELRDASWRWKEYPIRSQAEWALWRERAERVISELEQVLK